MSKRHQEVPFLLGAPSLVFGPDVLENTARLAEMVDNVEVVLFHTPELHNIPSPSEIQRLRDLGKEEGLSFTVHLPASLEPASPDPDRRREAFQLAERICKTMEPLEPKYYILHIPVTPPTLVAVPGCYLPRHGEWERPEWRRCACDFLVALDELMDKKGRLLVENINYSPCFLEPFWTKGLCGLCLDLGHLVLGDERVGEEMMKYRNRMREVHLHGVSGYREHISLRCMDPERVRRWLTLLEEGEFRGIVNLEVFEPRHLEESLTVVKEASRSILPGQRRTWPGVPPVSRLSCLS